MTSLENNVLERSPVLLLFVAKSCISLQCSGSSGTDFVSFRYLGGEYLLGYYTQICDDCDPPVISGSPATLEQMNRLYPTEAAALREGGRKRPARLVQAEEAWEIHLPTGALDQVFASQELFRE